MEKLNKIKTDLEKEREKLLKNPEEKSKYNKQILEKISVDFVGIEQIPSQISDLEKKLDQLNQALQETQLQLRHARNKKRKYDTLQCVFSKSDHEIGYYRGYDGDLTTVCNTCDNRYSELEKEYPTWEQAVNKGKV